MIGYVAMVLILLAYSLLALDKMKWFIRINFIATALFVIHAYNIWDIPFLIVEIVVVVFLAVAIRRK